MEAQTSCYSFSFAASDGLPIDEPGRQRKPHRKSRGGCNNCKSRNIKCDESRPHCTHCSNRGWECAYSRASKSQESPRSESHQVTDELSSEQSLCLISTACNLTPPEPYSGCDLERVSSLSIISIDPPESSLLRHFDEVTSEFLPFRRVFWKEIMATVALKNRYVMDAILTLAASHCRFLYATSHPSEYRELEYGYRSNALSGLRHALASPINEENFDPLLASAILLLFDSWSFVDTMVTDEIGLPIDDVLVMTPGLRDIVMQGKTRELDSIFGETIYQKLQIPKEEMSFPELQELRRSFSTARSDSIYDRAASLMISILSSSTRGISLETRRCLLAWPALCPRDYIAAVQENDEQALVILAHFYAAASTLSTPSDWLFASRSFYMCRSILTRLRDHWDQYLTMPKTICGSDRLDPIL